MQAQAMFTPSGFGTNDVQIMSGNFDEFSFDDVIQVLGLSRQCLRLLIRRGEAALSEILLKAGQVLDARMPNSTEPESVFRSLVAVAVRGSGLSFAVYHTEPTGPFPMPRGTLLDLVQRVRQPAPAAAPTPSAPAAGSDTTVRIQREPVTASLASGPAVSAPVYPAATNPMPAQTFAPTNNWSGPASVPIHNPQAAYAVSNPPTAPTHSPEVLGKLVAAEIRPIVREEIAAVLAQTQQQGQALHQMDGRLLALPQLVAAEIRLALAQQARANPPAAEAPAPARPAGNAVALAAVALSVVAIGLVIVVLLR